MTEAKQFVKDLKDKDSVASVFLASEKTLLKDRNGKPYLSLSLIDASGMINGRLWDRVDDFSRGFESGDFVFVRGHVQTYQNRRQVIIHDLVKTDPAHLNLKDFSEGPGEDPRELLQELKSRSEKIENKWIRELLLATWRDEKLVALLLKAPAAKSIHHAYLGGLVEHMTSVCRIMSFMAAHYKWLNGDLLIFGAIYHDLGKVWELSVEDGIKYTDRGRLVGHMALACEYMDLRIAEISDFPLDLRDVLKHIVLSHHGKLEYGSPKEPQLPEAMLVALVDELDSRLSQVHTFMKSEIQDGGRWSKLHSHFDRYFLLDFFREKANPRP